MKHTHYRYISIMLFMQCLLFLSGCTIVQWSATTFRQADKISDHFSKSMAPFIKSAVIYNEFASIAEFSALFLTDEARMIYADYFFHRNFKTPEEQEIARQRLLTENDYYITFYIIGYQPATIYPTDRSLFFGEYQVQGPLLGSADANWKVTLLVDGKQYAPCDVRSVQLPVEYQYFFDRHWSQFKMAYKVRFDYRDKEGNEIMPLGHHHVSLKFSSAIYDTNLEWTNMAYKLESREL
ncbi:MAG: hypothetical protein JO129_04380 [Candidatus Dependentiae bacterium]|nr:hypothetical protein [Candidatus Dependentiae bacterium]